jgi:tripartite-type tricarboxylate transporter receptor subunit TctC
MKRRLWAVMPVCAVLSVIPPAHGQSFPTKPIRLVIAFAPGGGTDVLARMLLQALSEGLGQQVIPDNRPGADGVIASELVAAAQADGYTLLITSSSHAINPGIGRRMSYDTMRDFAPVTQTASQQIILVVHPSLPVKSVRELIDYAKAKPDALNYGTSSNSVQLSMELFKSMVGIRIAHIPYKGSGPMLNDLLGGQIQLTFGASVATLPQIRAGKLRALAIGDSKRSAIMPDLPTVAEAGVPGYQSVIWSGVLAPARTPRPVIDRLHGVLVRILHQPDMKERLVQLGSDPVGSTPDQFGAFISSEIQKWVKIAKVAGVKAED